MKRIRKLTALALVGIALAVSPAAAQDPNAKIMEKLFSKIGQVVGVGSNNPVAGESFLVLANPGVLIDPTIDTSTPEGRYKLSRVLDRVLLPSWIYKTNNDRTMQVYQTVLDFKEPPVFQLTAQQKQLLEDARKVVFKDVAKRVYSDDFERYRKTRRALAVETKSVEDYKRAHPNDSVPATLLLNLQEARENYNLVGNKNKMTSAKATIDTYEQLDPNVWWGNLRTKFDDNVETFNGTPVATFNLYPAYENWLDNDRSWWNVALTQSDVEQSTSSSHSSVGGGFSAGWGLWSVGADYDHQENRTYFSLDVSNYAIEMELSRVEIDRPWLESQVFRSRAWKWLASSPIVNDQISDGGDATKGVTPKGVMPFLPTGILLARNVKMSGTWSKDLKTTFDEQTSGGGSIGWGPFSFGGRTDNSNSSTYKKANAAGNSISFDDPQILGFFVEVLPRSPNPDPALTFPSGSPAPPSGPLMVRPNAAAPTAAERSKATRQFQRDAKRMSRAAQSDMLEADKRLLTEANRLLKGFKPPAAPARAPRR